MKLRTSIAFFAVLLSCLKLISAQYNLTSSSLGMYRDVALKITFPFSAQIACPNPNIQLRNVDRSQYENCAPLNADANILIGHCGNGDNSIILNVHSTHLHGMVAYQLGNTYYYAAYGSQGENNYCDMYKFQIEIVSPEDLLPSSTTIIPEMSSSSIFPSLSSSFILTTSSVNDMNIQPSFTTSTNTSPSLTKTRPTTYTYITDGTSTSSSQTDVKPSDKPGRTSEYTKLEPTNTPTRTTVQGVTSRGMHLRGSNILMTCTLLLLAMTLPLLRTLS